MAELSRRIAGLSQRIDSPEMQRIIFENEDRKLNIEKAIRHLSGDHCED